MKTFRILYVIFFLSFAFGSAYANGKPEPSPQNNKAIAVSGSASQAVVKNTLKVSNTLTTAPVSVSVNNEVDHRRIPVSSARAAALTAVNGTCAGSSSGGVQGAAFGLSIASTHRDESCNRRYDSIRLQELGFVEAATLLMCDDVAVRRAMKLAGTACPEPEVVEQKTVYQQSVGEL